MQLALASLLFCLSIPSLPALSSTLTFQEGVAGYSGTEDLHLSIPANFTGLGTPESQYATDPDDAYWVWDFEATTGAGSIFLSSQSTRIGMSDQIGLLRFRDLFGDAPGQIPPGAQITSATLSLVPLNYSPGGFALLRKPGDAANLFPLCTDGGTGGLCGGAADGDWVLNLWDEHQASSPTLVSWAITLSDGVSSETYSTTPNVLIPSRHRANGYAATIHSSENSDFAMRPRLEVSFVETAVFSPTKLAALPNAGAVDVVLTLPDGSTSASLLTVYLSSNAPSVASASPTLLWV